ncbi:uncharacterized protein [Amphiura filiformis]|uniref:uncharacterized protein n=1 Tax=Amphiura filiformis TaxID=82378 RepID=UPI003B225A0F
MATSGKPFIPMVSSTPPPIDDGFEDEEEDDFGSFATAGFGKDLIGSPPGKKPAEKNDKLKFNFEPIENSIPETEPNPPLKASGNGENEDDDFGNFASFAEQSHPQVQKEDNNGDFGKTTKTDVKYPPQGGGLFSEFSSARDSEEEVSTKPNGTWNHHNHIESSSNNNSAGDTIGHTNYLNNSGDLDEEQESDHSFKFKLSKEDTLDLRQSDTYNVDNIDDEAISGEINWDVQGAATPSSRSRSPDISTSGTHTPVTGAQDLASTDSSDPISALDSTSKEVLPELHSAREQGKIGDNKVHLGEIESGGPLERPSDSLVSENVPSNHLSSSDAEKSTDGNLETLENRSRTKTDSFGEFSSGPNPILGSNSIGEISQGTSEISHENSSNNLKNTSSVHVDSSRTLHSDDDDDEESSLGKPEPPAFPENDHEEEEDEFGDFGSFSKTSNRVGDNDDDDDFGDFGTFKSTSSGSKEQQSSSSTSSLTNRVKSADEFGGFESSSSLPSSSKSRTDDFGDFGAFHDSKAKDSASNEEEDEFGDFGTFASGNKEPQDSDSGFASFQSTSSSKWATSPTKPTQPTNSSWGSSTSRIDRVFQTCFPTLSELPNLVDNVEPLDIIMNNESTVKGPITEGNQKRTHKKPGATTTVCVSVWASLSDLENTRAVRYQWASSGNSKLLLASPGLIHALASKKAAGIPIFAANLGMLTPSKPGEKAEHQEDTDSTEDSPEHTSGSATVSNNITSPTDEPVAKVEFDWVSSGLTNPLDANSLNLDFFTKEGKSGSSSGPGTSSKSKSRSAPPIDPEILGLEINLPPLNKPRQNTSKPLDDILKNSTTSTMVTQRNKRDAGLSGEAKRILDGIPNMSFMHAKVLMFPVGPSPLSKLNGEEFSGRKESTL